MQQALDDYLRRPKAMRCSVLSTRDQALAVPVDTGLGADLSQLGSRRGRAVSRSI